MIDLTKPIRRKKDGRTFMQAAVAHFHTLYPYPTSRVEDGIRVTPDELERDYENIPEPYKPRQVWLILRDGEPRKTGDAILASRYAHAGFSRFVEWPQDAPLPDWPEGYE